MPNFWKIVNSVIDKADVIIEVLDARLIDETRNKELENKVKLKGKKLLYVINKCDLVDKDYVQLRSRHLRPSVYVSSRDHLGTTILLKKILELSRKSGFVGIVGYPNTGKSSLINALAGRGRAKASSFSGFTKGKQHISLGAVTLIDTPGVIPFDEGEIQQALVGAKDPSKLKDPDIVAMHLIEKMEGMIESYYSVKGEDSSEILDNIAIKYNKKTKGGEPDIMTMSRKILKDWQTGKIRPSST